MSQQELLIKVIETLDQNDIDYMITGSVASSLQGEPRSTYDIDVVVAIQKTNIETLREAISHKTMFNLIDVVEGDLWNRLQGEAEMVL